MSIRILVGDCRQSLRKVPSGAVRVVVTSPPYYGLRDYSTDPLVWGGRGDCEHLWGDDFTASTGRNDGGRDIGGRGRNYQEEGPHKAQVSQGQFCHHCQAWRGSLGLEPDLEMYTAHLVEIFREVRRVLRDDGVLILNLGDSYASSTTSRRPDGKGNGITGDKAKTDIPRPPVPLGLKPKDLMGIPWRVALALQADGWWLRSAMPWLKASAMPESVRDRPTTAHEYVFLLSKSKKYYWDAEAIRVNFADARMGNPGTYRRSITAAVYPNTKKLTGNMQPGKNTAPAPGSTGRNYRTTDAYIAPLDHAIAKAQDELARLESLRDTDGLLLDEDGSPVTLKVNPGNFKGAHFATFPVGLVEPFVKAGSKPGDTVLDPFGGAMTTMMVADRLGRNGIACELNPDYAEMGRERLVKDGGMFMDVRVE